MASNDGEDTDLDALRSAVLATLKTKGRNDSSSCVTTEDEGSRNDTELEELRKAALQSKRLLDNENKLQTSFRRARFPAFRRGVGFLKGYHRNENLIVIKPVEESTVYMTNSQPAIRSVDSEDSQQPRRLKSSGKFSRFESDSENSDDTSDEEDDSRSSNDTSSEEEEEEEEEDHSNARNDDDDDTSQETIEDNVLLLHPDEDLQDDAMISTDNGTAASVDKKRETIAMSSIETNGDSTYRASGSSHDRRRLKESKSDKKDRDLDRDRPDRSSKRGESGSAIAERHEGSGGGGGGDTKQRDDSRKATRRARQRQRQRHETRHGDDRKEERRRSKRHDNDKSRKTRDKHRRSLATITRRGSPEKKQTTTTTTTQSLVKDTCKAVLRSRNASPTTLSPTSKPTIDLREKLRQKKEHLKTELCDGSSGRGSPLLRSVLSVVTTTAPPAPILTSVKSKSRSPMPTSRTLATTTVAPRTAVRRKSESPGRLGQEETSAKPRKVLILSGEKTRTATTKTTTTTSKRIADEIEASPLQRIPVRERLGIAPNNAKSSSPKAAMRHSNRSASSTRKSKSPPNRLHQRRASPTTEILADDGPPLTDDYDDNGNGADDDRGKELAKRRVKLDRGTFASLIVSNPPSTSIKVQPQEDKIGRHKGLPTFENELDDRIRRIQVNNEAILKRKYEISCDRHRHK